MLAKRNALLDVTAQRPCCLRAFCVDYPLIHRACLSYSSGVLMAAARLRRGPGVQLGGSALDALLSRRTRPAIMDHQNDKQPTTFCSFMVAWEGLALRAPFGLVLTARVARAPR
jgi:hypothetical protein